MNELISDERLTYNQKQADDQQYYRDKLDLLDNKAFTRTQGDEGISEWHRKKVNYDLINNKLNLTDFSYVCSPYGSEMGELPAQMANRDIISGKIKAMLGMEAKRAFSWGIIGVNEESTTRKAQAHFDMIKQFVVSSIMTPIQIQIEQQYQQQQNPNQPLTDQQKQQIAQQIQQETQAKTPDEVKKYMAREHKDPAEMQSQQILNFLIENERLLEKFDKALFHGLVSGEDIIWVGVINAKPAARVINSLFFDYAKTPDGDPIEDSEWGAAELRLSPSELISRFRDELSDDDIQEIYETYHMGSASKMFPVNSEEDNLFNFDELENYRDTIRVLYGAWKGERKVGFLTYKDDNGDEQEMLVPEGYQLDGANGDIRVKWDWIPETQHGYKICLGNNKYVGMGAVPGQNKDINAIGICKLPFYGCSFDSINSNTVSLVDRMKAYQYYYNIIMYRIELLMAADKGKVLAFNINAIPKSAGLTLKHVSYMMESNHILWYNPNEEGNKVGGTGSVGDIAKEIDMSTTSDIAKYLDMARYIEERCGQSVGITDEIEGQVSAQTSVRNAQQNLVQSSNILEPYFQQHNNVKRNVLQALIETAKVCYSVGKPLVLNYIMDDLSYSLTVDQQLLDNSTMGIFVGDSTNDNQAKQAVEQLAHAAMQNQQIDLLDVVKIIRATDINQAEEDLTLAREKAQDLQAQQADQQSQQQQQIQQMQQDHEQKQWAHEIEVIKLKAQLDKETKVEVETIAAMGFDPDKDEDSNGEPDVLQVAKDGVDAHIKMRKQALDETKAANDFTINKGKLANDKAKIAVMKQKVPAKS